MGRTSQFLPHLPAEFQHGRVEREVGRYVVAPFTPTTRPVGHGTNVDTNPQAPSFPRMPSKIGCKSLTSIRPCSSKTSTKSSSTKLAPSAGITTMKTSSCSATVATLPHIPTAWAWLRFLRAPGSAVPVRRNAPATPTPIAPSQTSDPVITRPTPAPVASKEEHTWSARRMIRAGHESGCRCLID